MATNSRQSGGKTSVSMPVLILAVVLSVLFLGGLGWYFFTPNSGGAASRPLTAAEQADVQWMKQKAKESGGDFNKLSQEDQRKLFAMRGAKAPFDLLQEARTLNHGQ